MISPACCTSKRQQIVLLAGQCHSFGIEYHSLLGEVHCEVFVAIRHHLMIVPCLQHSRMPSLSGIYGNATVAVYKVMVNL